MKQYIKPAAELIDLASRGVFVYGENVEAHNSTGGSGEELAKGTDWIEDDFDDSDDGWGW